MVLSVVAFDAAPCYAFGHHLGRTAYYATVTTYYVPAVTTAAYAPTVAYYAPTTYVPTTAYCAPAPVATCYAPATTAVSAAVTSYYAPAVAAPGTTYYVAPRTTVVVARITCRSGLKRSLRRREFHASPRSPKLHRVASRHVRLDNRSGRLAPRPACRTRRSSEFFSHCIRVAVVATR